MTNRVRLSALLLTTALTLAACGGSDKDKDKASGDIGDQSVDKILAASEKQLAAEEFISVKGTGTDEDDGTELEVDLGFAGDTASGTITVGGLTLELLKADGTSYFKASDDFYRSTAGESADQVIELIAGRWVVADPEDENFGEIASFVSKDDFFEELLEPDGKVTKVDDKSINGVDCVGLKSDDSTFYFDKRDGKPISLVSSDDSKATLNFSYDEIDEVEAPTAEESVDLSQLAG